MTEAGSTDDDTPPRTWFGYPRTSETVGGRSADVVSAPSATWSAEHRRRLLQSRTIDGLVPTLGLRRADDSTQAFQLPAPGRTLTDALDSRAVSGFDEIVSAIEAAALATHAGHLSGLIHGALGTDDIHVVGNEIAVSGMGLGQGGTAEEYRSHFVAPEVAAGASPTVRSDVYGLGRVLEAGLGRMQGVAPADAQALIAEATDPEPSNRPPSAQAFARRLGALSGRRRRRFGLAALGSSVAARQLAPAVSGDSPSDEPTAAGSVAAAGAAVAGSGFAASRLEPTTAAVAASSPQTPNGADDRSNRGRRRAGWALAGLAGLGGLGLYAVSQRDDDPAEVAGVVQEREESTSTTAAQTTTVSQPTTVSQSTTAAETTAAPSTTAAQSTTAAETTAAPSTTAPSTTESDDATSTTSADLDDDDGTPEPESPPVVSPMAAGDAAASFEILHAVSGTPVDAYIDGALAAPGFAPGTLAGPLPLSSVGQPIDLFAAMDEPPTSVDDREDKPLLAGPIALEGPGTLVAFVDDRGTPVFQAFANNLDAVPAGQGRLAIRHVAAVGPATIFLDGQEVASAVPAGSSVVLEVAAGSHSVRLVDADGNELLSQEVDADEGELTSAWIRGDVEALGTSVRRIVGLQTAPSGIPSGSAGLADDPFTAVGDGIVPAVALMVLMGGSGLVLQRRGRT